MKLSRKAIEEFKIIYKEKTGKSITDDDAEAKALDFLQLFDLITKSPKQIDQEESFDKSTDL